MRVVKAIVTDPSYSYLQQPLYAVTTPMTQGGGWTTVYDRSGGCYSIQSSFVQQGDLLLDTDGGSATVVNNGGSLVDALGVKPSKIEITF